jgi:hypothetical protein
VEGLLRLANVLEATNGTPKNVNNFALLQLTVRNIVYVLSRKVLTKLITSPGATYFSTKKNRNVKEPLVSSHTIPV